jgi:uncharacterized protein (TIGR03437 family)
MERQRKLVLAKVAVVMGAIPLLIWAHASGPDVGKSGVPGESTCTEALCHVGTALNGGNGSVKVTFPNGATYSPGVKQHLVVTIADTAPTQKVWGFQLTARQAGNTRTPAGTFASTDRFTGVVCGATPNDPDERFLDFGQNQNCAAAKPFTYIEHSIFGSGRIQAGSQTYEFDWTPPSTDVGPINIYVAGNAANGDTHETGDHIYTASYTLTPAAAPGVPAVSLAISAGSFGAAPTIAPGTWVEIYGTSISPSTREWAGSDFNGVTAPTSVDGVKVTIGGKPAFISYVTSGQVNAQVPSDVATGAAQITVTNTAGTSGTQPVTVNALQPGLLAPPPFLIGGKQYVVAQFADGSYVLPPNSISGYTTHQAKPGETIVIYGIGFGPVLTSSNANIPAGQIVKQANQLANPMQMQFGGVLGNLTYFGLAPDFVGLYQFNVVVPAMPNDDAVPLTFTLNGTKGSQVLYTAVKN